jgi:hypothetical protein
LPPATRQLTDEYTPGNSLLPLMNPGGNPKSESCESAPVIYHPGNFVQNIAFSALVRYYSTSVVFDQQLSLF